MPTTRALPLDDARRVAAVTATGLLDTAPEERFDRLVTLATTLLDARTGYFVLRGDDRYFLKSCVGLPAAQRSTLIETSLVDRVVASGEPLLLLDGARGDEPGTTHLESVDGAAVAWAGHPVRDNAGYVIGSCHVTDTEPRNWSEQDEAVLRTFAAAITAEIAQGGTSEASDVSEQRFRIMADAPTVMLWSASEDGALDYVSQSWLRWRGTQRAAELGRGWIQGIHPADSEAALGTLRTAVETGQPFGMELRFRKADGDYAWVLDSGSPRYDADGELRGYIGYLIDIDESRRRKIEIDDTLELLTQQREHWQQWAQREGALQRVTASLSRALSPEEMAKVLVAEAAAVLGARGAACSLGDPATGTARLTACTGDIAAEAIGANTPLGAVVVEAARRQEPIWLPAPVAGVDHAGPEKGSEPVSASPVAPTGVASIPLLWSDTCLGVLTAVFDDARGFGREDKALTLSVAKRGAEALERARLYAIEHEIAQTLQRDLLPISLPEPAGVSICAQYRASSTPGSVGGDWYEALEFPDNQLWLSVGDVVGHGPHTAAVMAQLRSALQGFAMQRHGPEAALSDLNRLATKIPGALTATAAACLIDIDRRSLRYMCAGHLPPLLLSDTGAPRFLWDGRRPPLGTQVPIGSADGAVEVYAEGSVSLHPGDTVILYTDGLIERRGELLDVGLERLARLADRHGRVSPNLFCDAMLAEMFTEHTATDDIVVIAVRLDPDPARRYRVQRPAHGDELAGIRQQVRSWLADAGIDADTAIDITIAVEEAAANSVEHAYLNRTPGTITLTMDRKPDGTLCVQVSDDGVWRDRPAPGNRGRGLPIMRAVMDDVVVGHNDDGTTVRMEIASHTAG